MLRKENKAVLECNGPVPQKEGLESGQLTMGMYIDFLQKDSIEMTTDWTRSWTNFLRR